MTMELKEMHVYGELSEASYADLRTARKSDGTYLTEAVKTALLNIDGGGFSPTQAANFVTHWRVVHHQPDTLNGFSATLFERLDSAGHGTGGYSLAIRGTLGVIDFAEDIFGVAAQGVARSQAVDLYRYYKQLTTPKGHAVNYAQGELLLLAGLTAGNFSQLTTTSNYLSIQALTSNDVGLLQQPLSGTVDITGHSLGGHLAMLFTRMFPSGVGHVYTYNGAGLGGVAKEIFDLAGYQVDEPSSLVSNIVADQGLDLTAGVGYVIGPSKRVFIEQGANPLENHRIGRLVDSLAIQQLLNELDPSLDIPQISSYLSAASAEADNSLETVSSSLAHLFGAALPTSSDERENLYQQLQALRSADGFTDHVGDLKFVPTLSLTPHAHSDDAEGLAYRYALEKLNPFAVLGPADLYAPHNDQGQLDMASHSDAYLSDRARMLAQVIRRNRADSTLVVDSPFSNEVYEDVGLDIQLATSDVAGFGEERPAGAVQYVFGSNAGEEIQGGDRDDHLYGQAGDDILQGNAGDDYLEGGPGNDLYITQQGDGLDTIHDTDGSGRIVIEGDLLTGGPHIGDGRWRSADGRHHFAFDGDPADGTAGTLYIDGRLRVEHFRNGDLGIELSAGTPETPEAPQTLYGTPGADALSPGLTGAGRSIHVAGAGGNDLIATTARDDTVDGGDGNDWIDTFAGDDIIRAGAGDDAIFPGAGRDTVDGGPGDDLIVDAHYRLFNTTGNADRDGIVWSDLRGEFSRRIRSSISYSPAGEAETDYTLLLPQEPISGTRGNTDFSYTPSGPTEGTILYTSSGTDYRVSYDSTPSIDDRPNYFSGGPGNDFIGGNRGDDMLLGGPGNDRITAGAGNDTLLGGGDDDLLIGGPDDDWLDAGPGRDTAYGGSGGDSLYGGEDDDTLYGDNGTADAGGDDFLSGGGGGDSLYGNGGDDHIDGGAGDDRLWGQLGRDTLLGGDGDDQLHGGRSADTLFGGTGNDRLLGEAGDDWLFGGDGSDALEGGDGADRLDAGADGTTDTLSGGAGDDVFIYHPNGGIDLITDAADNDRILLQDILPEDLTLSVRYNTDGQDLLALQVDANDILLVADGITGGPGEYRFSDGTRLSPGELTAQLLHDPLTFHLDQAASLHGGTAGDTLVGSPGDDRLYGHGGDDILAGAGGNDWLDGGAGRDRYLIGPGTGLDIIEEGDGAISELALLPGIQLDQLHYRRSGDDLRVLLPGDTDGATLRHFFIRDPAWSVQDSEGGQRLLSPATISAELEPLITDSPIAAQQALFTGAIEQVFGNALRLNGYRLQSDGRWHGDEASGSYRRRRAIDFAVHTETSTDTSYTRSLRNYSTLSSTSHTTWEQTTTTVNQHGTIRVPAGEPNARFISLEALAQRGISGLQLSGDAMPVYGDNERYNPLTGALEPEITGYRLAPGGGIPLTRTTQRQRTVTDTDMQVNILDLTLGVGDDHFDIRLSNATGFNLVDGGAGDDELDASRGYVEWGQRPVSWNIPGGDYWSSAQLPGSLLYGNEGNDRLIGGDGADELIGGAGDDYLQGGVGNDTYRILSSTGMDTLYEDGYQSSLQDRLILPADIRANDIEYSWGTGLYRNLDTSNAWVKNRMTSLHNTFSLRWGADDGVTLVLPHSDQQAGLGIETVVFGDGREVSLESLLAGAGFAPEPDPQQEDNILYGSEFLHGYEGDDTLIAAYPKDAAGHAQRAGLTDRGRDRLPGPNPGGTSGPVGRASLIGGGGTDRLIGGEGNDRLYGNDIVADYSRDFLEARGNLWDPGNEYDGGPGHDRIWATAGSDLIRFGPGDGWDTVTDLFHDDVYFRNRDRRGYGLGDPRLNDYWYDFDDPAALAPGHSEQLRQGIDTLRFKEGIRPQDIQVRPDDDQGLTFAHINGQDGLTFTHWFDADLNQLGRVEFSDGTVWNRDAIDALAQGLDPARLSPQPSAPVAPTPGLPAEPTAETGQVPSDAPDTEDLLALQPEDPDPTGNPIISDDTDPWSASSIATQDHGEQTLDRQVPLPAPVAPRVQTPPRSAGSTASFAQVSAHPADRDPTGPFELPDPATDAAFHQQWDELQRALRRLDAGEGAQAAPGRQQRSGLGADILSGLFGRRPARTLAGHDPVSLSPGGIQLNGLAGLSEGMRPLPW